MPLQHTVKLLFEPENPGAKLQWHCDIFKGSGKRPFASEHCYIHVACMGWREDFLNIAKAGLKLLGS